MKIYINHLGYEPYGPKSVIVESNTPDLNITCTILDENRSGVYSFQLSKSGQVENWERGHFYKGDFSGFNNEGKYSLKCTARELTAETCPFEIRHHILPWECLSDILFYFKGQRCSGAIDHWDSNAPFYGSRNDKMDLHGGWYDASGDFSKYLSHLSYANYMNPQQTPMVLWNLLAGRDFLNKSLNTRMESLLKRYEEEALFGADFLVRMQDPEGYFYMTLFDQWSKDITRREICAYETEKGYKNEGYQSGYRQGAGVAIAALARIGAATWSGKGETQPEEYLKAAERGFAHLEYHNCEYLDNGKENIIDDYCALLAATELYIALEKEEYLTSARQRAKQLMDRQSSDDQYQFWWRSDDNGDRPYFHAAEAGLPIIALLRYCEAEPNSKTRHLILETVDRSLDFELTITEEVANPFGYPRQYVKPLDGPKRGSFFFPHVNESGYWWQGENARLGSLAAAAFYRLHLSMSSRKDQLTSFATNCINWILGLNPYDMCMLHGKGRNNPEYLEGYPNAPGGVCNGITGGVENELQIAFKPEGHAADFLHNWRWGEQWIPHGAWLLLALSLMEKTYR